MSARTPFNHTARRIAIACTALAASAFVPAAQAGCGLTITFDNESGQTATVLLVEAKGLAGQYESVHKKNFDVGAGKKVEQAIETVTGCVVPQYIRAKYKIGNSTKYASKGPLATAVDKKYTLELDK